MQRSLRIGGTVLLVAGALVLIWVVVVWRWQDPFTALYTHWQQHRLSHSYQKRFDAYRPARISDASGSSEKKAAVPKDMAQESE